MTSQNIYVIITAAGSGKRFSKKKSGPGARSVKPKQFQNLLGKPVILYSLLQFQKIKEVKSIVISADKKYFDYVHSLAAKHKITKLKAMVEGGNTRFESVRNAFKELNSFHDDIVMIHDAARPNVRAADLIKIKDAAFKNGEVIPGTRIPETVKRTKKEKVTETIPRDDLWLIQTPQAFRYNILSRAYILAGKKIDFTDESSLVEYAGFKVRVIEGNRNNIKITTQEDLDTLKKIMK